MKVWGRVFTKVRNIEMNSFINVDDLIIDEKNKKDLSILCHHWTDHKFILLGNQEVKVDYSLEAPGFIGIRYNSKAIKKYGKVKNMFHKSNNYESINWFVDYKSGFFFHPNVYNSRKKCIEIIGKKKGVDIKCPWELGRLYHLVPMAVYASSASRGERKKIIWEFYNEIQDFIESNPIGQTVQWAAPMDVSIRIVNILIAFDILKQLDDEIILNIQFESGLIKHIRRSARYVLQNLEYSGRTESNHYLSNLVGLIYAAAYLPSSQETDAWLVFAVQELIEQVKLQFHRDGSNFEGSTSYHRLSTEFVLYATALVYGVLDTDRRNVFTKYRSNKISRLNTLERQKYNLDTSVFFPEWYIDRLCNAGKFTNSILKANNEIVQIGDNDSGRLVKLSPVGRMHVGEGVYFEENVLDHRTLLSSMNGLFKNEIFDRYGNGLPLEKSLIETLSHKKRIFGKLYDASINTFGNLCEINYPYQKENVLFDEVDNSISLLRNANVDYYEEFGVVIFKSDRLFLSMVIDTTRYGRLYGHTHNDKMSIELLADGAYITRDPGGYIYTAAPKLRDKFRSTMMHNCIHVEEKEQNIFTSTFDMKKRAKGELLYCDGGKIIGKVLYSDVVHLREIVIYPHKIVVSDYANQPFKVTFKNGFISTGYGKIQKVDKK